MKVKVLTPFVGPDHSYMIGDFVQVDEPTGFSWIKHSMAEAIEDADIPKDALVLEHPKPQLVITDGEIPEGIAGYDDLIEAGLTTIIQVKAHEDLTQIKGIGKATAAKIREALNC